MWMPFSTDHWHLMLSDQNRKDFYPGYSLIGKMKGLVELRGLELGIRWSLGI
jgi:mannonate dehydratase